MKKLFFILVIVFVCFICANSINVNSTNVNSNVECFVSTKHCQVITKKGTQCKRNAQSGSNYCWQHSK